MVISCQECGKEVEERFQFCPFCGKKLIKPKICSDCGFKLKENFMFCPDCGKKWDSSEKTIMPKPEKEKKTGVEKAETIEKVEETKPLEKPKSVEKVEPKAALPKISRRLPSKLKMPGKKVLMIISVICIVLVAAAAVILFNPFNNANTNGSPYGGRTFSIVIENNYGSNVICNLKVGAFLYGISDFSIPSGETFLTEVIEDALNQILLSSDYDITLFVSSDEGESSDTAIGVTESATFVISDDNGIISVNCTGSQ